tara:strand:+ start:1524 stop:1982 length:459 start_codon:yes stop_codon:yes gene_type:complete
MQRDVTQVKVDEVVKKDETFYVTTIRYGIEGRFDEPGRAYTLKLGAPYPAVNACYQELGEFVQGRCTFDRVPAITSVTWKQSKEEGIPQTYVQIAGTCMHFEFKTVWLWRQSLVDEVKDALVRLQNAALDMVDKDATTQTELFPAEEEAVPA